MKNEPNSVLTRRFWARAAIAGAIAAVFLGGVLIVWLVRLDNQIAERFAGKRFAPPVEFYSAPEIMRAGSQLPKNYLESAFARRGYRARQFGQPLQHGDHSAWSGDQCRAVTPLPADVAPMVAKCVAFRNSRDIAMREPEAAGEASASGEPTPDPNPETAPLDQAEELTSPAAEEAVQANSSPEAEEEAVSASPSPVDAPVAAMPADFKESVSAPPQPLSVERPDEPAQIAAFDAQGRLLATFAGAPPQPAQGVRLAPELFAQYYGEKPTLRTVVPLGAVPNDCINALVAIEDASFWEHSGVSPAGLARAAWVFLRSGRASQGGSTLTQQLVKNYFLTDERTIRRKAVEFAMALLMEARQSKPDILETYINLIYMGQNGAFQVRGWAAASAHYFGQDIQELSLPQCALMAAIVNSPGLYNPFLKPENALKRRAKVLDRMAELRMIGRPEAEAAKKQPLPPRPRRALTEPAPYFVQAVRRQLQQEGVDDSEGLRVYTTLNLRAQEAAQQAARAGLERIESTYPQIKKLKEKGKRLEAALLAADPSTGQIQAVVGGRSYLATQFNRAFDSHRQVGSVMKPFAYLAALESMGEDGKPYGPLSPLKDEAFTHKYQGQSWSPKNYEGKHFGNVPMYFALKESLNAATASLGLAVGLGNIVDVSRRLGVQSKIEALPSLTLGAFELYPWEVLQAYGTISRFGSLVPLTFIVRAERLDGSSAFDYAPRAEQAVAPETMAVLVGMMKQTILTGSARGARLAGFTHPAAGKTGTTNDKKDAWFAGFTPYHTAVVWIGYDDNTSHNLSGGSGAVPIWTSYMKAYGASFPADDFKWPAGTQAAIVPSEMLAALNVPSERGAPEGSVPAPVELVFRQGQAPEGVTSTASPQLLPSPSPQALPETSPSP